MTTDHYSHEDSRIGEVLPEDLLRARDRVARNHAKAARSIGRSRTRRRFLPTAIVGSILLVIAGLADRFVQSSLPRPVAVVSPPPPSVPAYPSTANTLALAQVTRTLAADQKAIAALAQAQAQLARSAGQAGQDGGSSVAVPNVQIPSVSSLASLPNISVPNISVPTVAAPAPTAHATTGATVVVP